ncbi:glycoside hydrolase family 3 C-terminal domain-containing protein [Curtobacterium sp. VKM Ac-2889]|uniref:Glycoside hydrolase family 3 C-terminal domain-containing protein n=1 Tax=Curtobacterium poinsettiae TaxID=159612 RepID=A0ABT3S670_9MICO|nr:MULTISPECIES: glycoside hydrolase family 3 C-terminal domain-containing protein [Curtobacterium]MBF4596605.1 glycoside hydrolase family 3 C-terminal domain-containing protein [Curtobacterium sp. VKM Ac-1796]MBF4612533.1 glycoside hydrolase family 3 C-terminal domain-containing protein [Curtobacterium sp. VKM Ac-2889]MBT1610510.1 glycoside hydrolase family 3 C-terminal domain-containing protein [Curtobacterium flaccumfaciens pv. poinsettiae]MCS6566571.1 glycoside hydrolase family 3 C-terminal
MTTVNDASTASSPSTPLTERIDALLGQLTTDEKVQLLTGRDFWTTWPVEKIGLRRILMSDGPSGVRGEVWDERDPSLNLPSATALSASWDRAIAKRYGAAAAVEARRKGVDVVLGPTINLHRSPLGGRHFEAFSEDPVLTGDLAASYVDGVQENGVAATPKHYIANDYETDRFTASTEVSDRALRELYLLAFEKAVTEAHAWAVMSSYNAINGVTASENDLLETPLNSEWGFDGIVVSDWTGVRSVDSAKASQDVAMPGPNPWWSEGPLLAAVQSGEVPMAAIDRKVRRILTLAARVGALEGFEPVAASPVHVEDGIAFVREAEAEGTVLVRNTGVLPLDAPAVSRIAVIGHNADQARTQGGGSATVVPSQVVSPLDGIRSAFPGASVDYAIGAVVQEGIAEFPLSTITNPGTGEPGARVAFVKDGEELFVEDRRATALFWFGGDAPTREADRLDITTTYTAESTGTVRFGIGAAGRSRMWIDGELLLDEDVPYEGDQLGAAFLNPPARSVPVSVTTGQQVAIRIEYDVIQDETLGGVLAYQFGTEPSDDDPAVLIDAAVEAARGADVAVVVVGTNSKVESEGYDRSSLALPGHQDDLVRAVAAVNPNTVVVVNAGSPVEMPWRNDVAAVLLTWFGGQEYGNALADVLTGRQEPGGRLPTTWPVAMADVPVLDVTPVDGKVSYDEGVHVGYRAWLRAGTEPAYPFGHGLGYTTWSIDGVSATPTVREGDAVIVTATVANTGDRAGKHVVQVYASRAESAVDRPVRWLVGFAPVRLGAGESTEVSIEVPARAFAHWDGSWQYESGTFTLHVGASVVDDAGTASLELE